MTTVIALRKVPPKKVEIFRAVDDGWQKVDGDNLGPLYEGDSPKLKCISTFTWPPSRLVWMEEGNTLIDTTFEAHGLNSQNTHGKGEKLAFPPGANATIKNKPQSHVPSKRKEPQESQDNRQTEGKNQVWIRKPISKRNISKTKSNHNKLSSGEVSKNDFSNDFQMTQGMNYIELKGLRREHHSRKLKCEASNTNIAKSAVKTITINLALPVLSIQLDPVPPVTAGETTEVQCTVWGSHPPPKINWALGGYLLTDSQMWVSDDGNVSVSNVPLSPTPSDDGKTLSCNAFNPLLSTSARGGAGEQETLSKGLTKSTTIQVHYAPYVKAWLGKTLDGTRIKEGDDVYFECAVKAKPKANTVAWTHQGKLLTEGYGVLISNMTLVLQKVNRSQAGKYVCTAANIIGSSYSEPETLDVKFAPVCASEEARAHSVAKHENARIACDVHANPPDVSFTWTFNNTAEVVNVPNDRYVVEGLGSVVNYTPMTELDYGTLLCWAKNSIGKQNIPCVFQILAAGKPEPPHNCHLQEVTLSSLQVTCLPGDNGGDAQTFLLQVMETVVGGAIVAEVARPAPTFTVTNLKPATSYRLIITATNRRGESKPAHLTAQTSYLHPPRHETSAEPTRGRESNHEIALGVIVGAILAGVPAVAALLVVVVRACIKAKTRNRSDHGSEESDGRGKDDLEQGSIDTQASADPVLKDFKTKEEAGEETQRLLRTADSSPLRDHLAPVSEERRPIESLSDALTIKLAARPLMEVPVPPPVGYNQGYSPIITATDPMGRECSCTLVRMSSPNRSPVTIPKSVDDISGAAWSSSQRMQQQRQQQQHMLASCGYTLPRISLSTPSAARPSLSYINRDLIKDRISNATLSEFGASNSSVSTQVTSIEESSRDISHFQSLSILSKSQGPNFSSNNLTFGSDGETKTNKRSSNTNILKRPTQNMRIRSVSFSDDGKTESSV